MTPQQRRQRALRASAKVDRDLMRLSRRTLGTLIADLEAARIATIDALAAAPKDWQITQAKGVLVELERALVVWQGKAVATMQGAGEPAALLGMRLATDVLTAAGIEYSVAPMLPTSVLATAYRTLPDFIRDVSDEAILKVGRILRQSVLGQQTPLEAMHQIGRITGPAAAGPFRNAGLRSEMIVRTELGRISQSANADTMRQVGATMPGLQKEWVALMDNATRPHHRVANGQRVPVDDDFTVGGHKAAHPHDPRLPAAESVGCRCMALPWHRTFSDGQ